MHSNESIQLLSILLSPWWWPRWKS